MVIMEFRHVRNFRPRFPSRHVTGREVFVLRCCLVYFTTLSLTKLIPCEIMIECLRTRYFNVAISLYFCIYIYI
jgi:hypothetical protein